jgi:DNA-binding MarR family transcriptional regulator
MGDRIEARNGAIRLAKVNRARRVEFGHQAVLFSDPAWEIMIDTYSNQGENGLVDVSELSVSEHLTASIVDRYITALEKAGLIYRMAQVTAHQPSAIGLTQAGRERLIASILPD